MSEWNEDYQNEVKMMEFYFQRLYPAWVDIDMDFTKERPDSLDRLRDAVGELVDALIDFSYEVKGINEEEI